MRIREKMMMRTGIASVTVLMCVMGIVADVAAVPENNSSLTPLTQGAEKFDRVIGICHLAQNPAVPTSSAVNVIEPLMEVEDYLTKFEHIKVEGSISFRILQQPVHGLLRDGGAGAYSYVPETGYLGKDQATVLVEISGLKIKVRYFFQVLSSLPTDEDQAEYCPTYKWRISQVSMGSDSIDLAESSRIDFVSAMMPASN